MSDLIKLGGLWVNRDKNGNNYLAGRLSPSVRILIFKNDYRTEEKQPAYVMYLAPVDQPAPEDALQADERLREDIIVDNLPGAPMDSEEAPPLRSARPAPAPTRPAPPPARPASSAPPAGRPAPAPARPPARPAPTRRPEPPTDFEELEDPFAEK